MTEGFGGFELDEIQKRIFMMCVESGDPSNYFANIKVVVNRMGDDIFERLNYWNYAEDEFLNG